MAQDKYDIFKFRVGERNNGRTRVVEMHLKLEPMNDTIIGGRTYFLGFLTKNNIDDINKLYGEL